MNDANIEKQKVNISVAAKILGVGTDTIRDHMRRKLWDIGEALPPEKTGKKKWEYTIYKPKLYKHLGLDPEEVKDHEGRAS